LEKGNNKRHEKREAKGEPTVIARGTSSFKTLEMQRKLYKLGGKQKAPVEKRAEKKGCAHVGASAGGGTRGE